MVLNKCSTEETIHTTENLYGEEWTNSKIYFNERASGFQLLNQTIKLRNDKKLWLADHVQRYADNNFYAFSRGDVFAAFTNSNNSITRNITYHPFYEGDRICNYYNMSDCIYVRGNSFNVTLNNGEFKVYIRG
jgi:alpha-amylase